MKKVASNTKDFSNTGLKQSSLIKSDKIVRLSKSLSHRLLGRVNSTTLEKVNQVLKTVLDL